MQYKYFVAEWDIKTFVFYLSIIIISYILLSLVPNYRVSIHGWNSKSRKKYPLGIILVCIMLMIVKGLCIGARDVRTGYYFNFISATSFNNYRDNSVEIGYRLLMIIIRNIFGIIPREKHLAYPFLHSHVLHDLFSFFIITFE